MSPRALRWINLVLLQVAVVGPLLLASTRPMLAATMGWGACAVQLAIGTAKGRDLALMGVGAVLGTVVELGAAGLGLMQFVGTGPLQGMPLWLPPSWAMLAVAFAYLLTALRGRFVVSVVAGGLGSAASLGAATSVGEIAVDGAGRFAAVAIALGVVVGVISWVAARLDQSRASATVRSSSSP